MTISDKACRHCHSLQTTGLNLISPENQVKLDNYKQSRHFKKNEIIFSQGTKISHVYCIRSGLVKLETLGNEGGATTVGYLKGGDLIGLGSVLSQAPANYTAVAVEDTYACGFTTEFFSYILNDTPELALKYMGNLFNELRETQARLLSGVEKDVPARVAEALIYLKANFPDHNFTRREIAEWAGTTTESVIRTLSLFEEDDMIEQTGRQIALLDKNRLAVQAGLFV